MITKMNYFFIFVLMDESLIYIIILVVIYLIRFFMKSKEQEPMSHMPDEHDTMERPSAPKRPSTFEELLEQMGRGYKEDEHEEENERVEEETQYETLEDPYYQHRDQEALSAYEKSVTQAKSFKTIDEQVDRSHVDIKLDKDDWKDEVVASRYARMMKSPRSLKDAIIISELLNRKY
jgi:hypothetical protein